MGSVCVYVKGLVHVCAHVYGSQTPTFGYCFLIILLLIFFRQSLSLNLELLWKGRASAIRQTKDEFPCMLPIHSLYFLGFMRGGDSREGRA